MSCCGKKATMKPKKTEPKTKRPTGGGDPANAVVPTDTPSTSPGAPKR